MNRILLFCACCALWGCRTLPEASPEAIALSASTSEPSKTDALTAGDDVAVWACLEGTEEYFLEGEKFTVGTDGRSLITGTPVYYPDSKQAVRFCAYFPYHTGVFSVPTDQSTASALKQADLCWATASSTPVATPVPLEFRHLLARLIVTANAPTTKIAGTVVPSGALNPATGEFTLESSKSEVFTTGSELILPAQPLSRLVLTADGVEYVYDGSIALQSGQTTTLNLTLNPSTQTASLAGATTTAWNVATQTGDTNTPISNQIKLHWAVPHANYTLADKVILTLENPITKITQEVDATPTLIADESSAAACAYSLPVSLAAGSRLWYPFTITQAQIYQGTTLLREVNQAAMKGTTLYRSGEQTVAISTYIQVRDAATNTTDIKEWLNVDKDFGSMLVKVTTVGCDNWTAVIEGGDGVNVQPTTGTSGQVVRINWSPNLTASAKMGRVIKFSPAGVATAFTPVQTSQNAGPSTKAVLINGIYWATGNLIADGANGCKIGTPTDCGLYFQFGSLIGWSGGAAPNYDGTGRPARSTASVKTTPLNLNVSYHPSAIWPMEGSTTELNKPYFSVTSGAYSVLGTDIRQYIGPPTFGTAVDLSQGDLGEGRYAPMGIGDPCSYYLGPQWRTPSNLHWANLLGCSSTVAGWPIATSGISISLYNGLVWRVTRSNVPLDFAPAGARSSLTTQHYTDAESILRTSVIWSVGYNYIFVLWNYDAFVGHYYLSGVPVPTYGSATVGYASRCTMVSK